MIWPIRNDRSYEENVKIIYFTGMYTIKSALRYETLHSNFFFHTLISVKRFLQ